MTPWDAFSCGTCTGSERRFEAKGDSSIVCRDANRHGKGVRIVNVQPQPNHVGATRRGHVDGLRRIAINHLQARPIGAQVGFEQALAKRIAFLRDEPNGVMHEMRSNQVDQARRRHGFPVNRHDCRRSVTKHA